MTLAVRVDGQNKLETYTPTCDFSVWIDNFPRLVWEVCSDQHKDELRMRAYGTSIVKLANCILVDRHESPHFVLVAIYQTDVRVDFSVFYEVSGKVSQQLSSNHPIDMRLANSRQIYQWKEPLDLTNMSGRAEFTQRLYNLAKTFEADDENPFNGHSFAQGLAAYVNTDEFDSTLYSRKTKKRKTDTGTSPEGDAGPAGSDFTVQGYELISDVIKNVKDTFEPLYKV